METCTISELLLGINIDQENKLIWMQLLTNKFADDIETSTITVEEVRDSIRQAIENLAREKVEECIHTLLLLLSNMTISERNSEEFLGLITSDSLLGEKFETIMNFFLNHNPQAEIVPIDNEVDENAWIKMDPWQHVISVVCNLCQVASGRDLIVKSHLKNIAPQIRSRNLVRQRGSVGCLKSCLFDQEIHWWIVCEVNALSFIMFPLLTAIAFTEKEKEGMDPVLWLHVDQLTQDDNKPKTLTIPLDILQMLLECILLLCQRRLLREELRKRKVYPIIKNLDYTLEDEGDGPIRESIYSIVDLLMGEEEK
mmetsp:Transcript_10754/g.16207  ORF Transcript_10754/g.16207 Transcript_10754/m.16207 type:complete len:311 (-) Transcript_10754:93-1025(-)